MQSKKFKRAVECTKIHVDQLEIKIGMFHCYLTVYKDGKSFEMQTGPGEFRKEEQVFVWKIDGESYPIEIDLEFRTFTIWRVYGDSVETLEKITKHVLSFLKPRRFKVQFNQEFDFKNCFIWKYVKKLDDLIIQLIGAGLFCSSDSCSWSDFDILPDDVTSKSMEFRLDGIPYGHIRRMINDWIGGEKYEKLEEIHFFHGCIRVMEDELLKGIEWKENTFSTKFMSKKSRYIVTYDKHWDVKRTTDNRLATIIDSKLCLSFYIWNEKDLEEATREPMVTLEDL